MSTIVFNCLVKPEEADKLAEAFAAKLSEFSRAGRVESVEVGLEEGLADEQLVSQWEQENPEESLGERKVFKYVLRFEMSGGSLNELAMDLSELLTPRVDLPPDPVLREFDEMLETVATYPWNVAVFR
nr:hypothetical protein [Corynebacterium lactis]